MIFEFAPGPTFNFLDAFARRIGTTLQDTTLTLPPSLGVGTMTSIRLIQDFSLLIHHYTLQEELILRRTIAENAGDRISVLFHVDAPPDQNQDVDSDALIVRDSRAVYAIRITSANINSEMRFPAKQPVFFAVLTTTRPALKSLLRLKKMNGVVEQILAGKQGFLFYETLPADAQKALKTLTTVGEQDELGELRTWIQVQELLYWLFERLLARETSKHRPVHQVDADQLAQVRNAVVADLSLPPQLPELAKLAGMSVSKLTDLFRQVFGDSVYDYFQKVRMEEAGHLLTQTGYTVSEVGYRLGFTNLSYFSRLFEKHHGLTPKRYAMNRQLILKPER